MTSSVEKTTGHRTWKKPPFIANPAIRWAIILGVLAYVVWAVTSLPFNWERIQEGIPRAIRIFNRCNPCRCDAQRADCLCRRIQYCAQMAL
jgi:phosphonate transport system permease protein